MEDRTHTDKGQKVRAIVDDAIAELFLLGFRGPSGAAAAMAIQAIIRIDDPTEMKAVTKLVADLNSPDDEGAE